MSLNKFEADLMAIFIKDRKRFIKYSIRFKERHISNRILRFAYKVLSDYYYRYKENITIDVFKNEIMKTSINKEEKKQYYITIRKLFKRNPKTPFGYIEKNILEKIEREEFLESIDRSVREIEKSGSVSKAKRELLKKVMLGKGESGEIIRVLRDWKSRQIVRKELSKIPMSERFIPTPYSTINAVSYGIQKSEAATVAGHTGFGKSIAVGEFGANSLLGGFNVLHYTLENTAEQTAQRYDSRLTEIEYDTIKLYKFKGGQLAHFKETFQALSDGLNNDIVIKETVEGETDIISVDKTVEMLRLDGFNTDFLIIDSCDIMSSIKNYESYRLDRASIYWDFKLYCKLKKIPGITTTQLKATSKYKISTSEDLAESYDKARILDIVYILAQTEEDKKSNVFRFILDKNRDGPSGISVMMFKDSAKMRFLEVV